MNDNKEVEMDKIETFIDENISEAFDTLAIYQKCLEDEKKKWTKSGKCLTANNAAVTARSLRRIYSITKKNMELLDTALVQAYGGIFPDENKNKLDYSKTPTPGGSKTPTPGVSLNKTVKTKTKKKPVSAKLDFNETDENKEHQNGINNKADDDSLDQLYIETEETANVPMKHSTNGSKGSSKSGERLKVSTNLFRKSPAHNVSKQNLKRPLPNDGDNIEEITIESDESDSDTDTKRKKRKSLSDFDVSFSFE